MFYSKKCILPLVGGLSLGFGSRIMQRGTAFHTAECLQEEKVRDQPKITLYQYATCPFCCKTRAFLDYYGFEYEIVEVNPMFRKELKWTEYNKVPVVMYGDMQLNDSSLIISVLRSKDLGLGDVDQLMSFYPVLESKDAKGKPVFEYQNVHRLMYGEGKTKKEQDAIVEEFKWRKWVDAIYVHDLSPNLYRTVGEAFDAFKYLTSVGNFSTFERIAAQYFGAVAMYFVGKRVKKRHNLDDDVRLSLYEDTNSFMKAIGKKRKFMGGDKPNLAELNLYGVLTAIEGSQAFYDLLANTNVGPWFKRMKQLVNSHVGAQDLIDNRPVTNPDHVLPTDAL